MAVTIWAVHAGVNVSLGDGMAGRDKVITFGIDLFLLLAPMLVFLAVLASTGKIAELSDKYLSETQGLIVAMSAIAAADAREGWILDRRAGRKEVERILKLVLFLTFFFANVFEYVSIVINGVGYFIFLHYPSVPYVLSVIGMNVIAGVSMVANATLLRPEHGNLTRP